MAVQAAEPCVKRGQAGFLCLTHDKGKGNPLQPCLCPHVQARQKVRNALYNMRLKRTTSAALNTHAVPDTHR